MFKTLIILSACLIVFSSKAQEPLKGVEKKITLVNTLYPGFGQEFKVSPTTTWGYNAGLNIFFEYSESYNFMFGTTQTKYFELVPTAEVYYRWYYRLLKRQQRLKKTINNSAGYLFSGARILSPGIKFITENEDGVTDLISAIYAGWGFRRTIRKNLILDLSLRYEIQMENLDKVDFANVVPGLRLAYTINSERKH